MLQTLVLLPLWTLLLFLIGLPTLLALAIDGLFGQAMVAVGIGGHAFATTALLVRSFVSYRDTSAWLQAVFEQMKQRIIRLKVMKWRQA